ncbi:MAG TPA: AAA family ATPase, partial [Vicinamibacterales bacterium]
MSNMNPVSAKSLRVADRLARARSVRFVARQAELDLFRSALRADKAPFTVLYVHGPGGVGKTSLLREFARLAKDARRTVVPLDGRDIPPTRQAVLRTLEALSGVNTGEEARLAVPDRSLLLIDTYEALSTLDTWLRDTLLPDLPAGVIVVLAGRTAPTLPWRTDVAWAALTRIIELSNFAPGESVVFLESRGVAASAHANVLDFTHGHPLALSLVADVLATRPDTKGFAPHEAPDVVRHLLALFLDTVPAGRLREAIDIGAVARVTTEWLLVELLGAEEGRTAFHWLRGQSFIESGPLGVFPHDLVREVLIADARWRDDEGLRRLSRRIYSVLHAHIAGANGLERQRLQMDALYVTRTKPTNAAFFDWRALDDVRVEPAEPDDAEWIGGLTHRHEGPVSAELARSWWRTEPGAFHVFRGADDARFGFLTLLDIGQVDTSMAARDPAIAPALALVERYGPIRRGEGIAYLRWWMHAESYQAVTA